ncbi:hypothetical protein C0995_000190 [Termitomyces sp. Mi166|nr:hypothetical protein C0995_000190 [Termitomyces sp. Mi166\
MHVNGHDLSLNLCKDLPPPEPHLEPLQWNWEIEHADRRREAKGDAAADGAAPFPVDRKVLKDVVREHRGIDVGRIEFINAGTFHKAYLVTMVDHTELVASVARRYMPRLKTESEAATMHYLRENTNIPLPTVYHYDSNPYNRLGGEYVLMSKAPGVQLGTVFHSLSHNDLVKLLENLARLLLPLFAHRFTDIGSLYFGPNPYGPLSSTAPTPKAVQLPYSAFPFSPTLIMSNLVTSKLNNVKAKLAQPAGSEFHIGPIISWPFFGTNRGELVHPTELNRGPWRSSSSYFVSCAQREIESVIRENEGRSAPHRLHLDPDEIHSSRHHRLKAVPGDESDDSDEWDLEESEEEWEGPGDAMYRDYRRMQRSTFLIAHLSQREELVRKEMTRWVNLMERLAKATLGDAPESFGLDLHDLSLENIFVDAEDPTKITCIIDWESTTTRPLWQCAHAPAFVQSSPFIARLFREAIVKVGKPTQSPAAASSPWLDKGPDLAALSREWLFYESAGQRMRMAHRVVEWDGWEEGLVDSILGSEENEDEWFKGLDGSDCRVGVQSPPVPVDGPSNVTQRKIASKLPFEQEKEKEQTLNTTGDFCGGRGGELGRRLEAWLTINGMEEGRPIERNLERDCEPHNQEVLLE